MNNNTEHTDATIREKLLKSKKPLILSHVRPDGDAIGAMLSLYLALEAKGKNPSMVIIDGIPRKFKFLKGTDRIDRTIKGGHDLVVTVDCADIKRVGAPNGLPKVDINIDHHITNELYGETNLVDANQPAACAILAKHFPKWDLEIDEDVAKALLMGIVTDTIGFRTPNVGPEVLRLAASLMEKGANLSGIYFQSLTEQSQPASLIWGFALARLKFQKNLAWTTITLEDRKRAGYQGRDDADLTNLLSTLENIDIAVLFNEEKDDTVKISWRSKGNIDVSKIAVKFNGGGHPPAAGAEIDGKLEAVIDLVLGETKKYL